MREEQSSDQTGTKIDVNDVRHIPENFQKHQCELIKQAKEHSMQSQENTRLVNQQFDVAEISSKIDDNALTHTEPHETARSAEKKLGDCQGQCDLSNEKDMSEWATMVQQKRQELLKNGLLRSPAEKFVDEPTIGRAIRRFCYECNGFSQYHATNCQNTNCALWLFRRGKNIVHDDELPVWQDAHKRWLQKVGEWKPGTSDGNELDESDEASDD